MQQTAMEEGGNRAARRQFPRELKLDAVRGVADDRAAIQRVSSDLGLSATLVRRWVAEFFESAATAFPGRGHTRPERAEMARLRRENERLRTERDLLLACLRDVPSSAYVRFPVRNVPTERDAWVANSPG